MTARLLISGSQPDASSNLIKMGDAVTAWGVSYTTINYHARHGNIPGARRIKRYWFVPVDGWRCLRQCANGPYASPEVGSPPAITFGDLTIATAGPDADALAARVWAAHIKSGDGRHGHGH